MLDINIQDVLDILDNCRPYLIPLAIVLVAAIAVAVLVRKKDVALKKLARAQALVAVILATALAVSGICMGPMSTIISLAMGNGALSDETNAASESACKTIAGEGIVLLKNESNALPLANAGNLNVFGWASTNPCYGGTGSGAISDAYPMVTLLQGLENAGFNLNTELSKFYTDYRADHPPISPFLQDWTLPEPPASTYPEALLKNARDFSDTAVVVISRTGAEAADLLHDMSLQPTIWDGFTVRNNAFENNTDAYDEFPAGTHFLELSQSERDMVELVCDNFSNVIVVYNGSNAFELGFVNDYPSIKGALWCAGPGQNGFNALGEVLSGVINPSGRTSDIFVSDLLKAPYINNIGRMEYTNMDEFAGDMRGDKTTPAFVNYVEGIYVGYRFYETAAAEGFLDYDEAVVFPFGHGLSYTTFQQEMGELQIDADGNISFDVNVTNTGSVPGKEVVEVYYEPPYTNGGIEKAAANLIAFDKTEELAPGATEQVHFSFNHEDMASFDTHGQGCYVLEAGDYNISIRQNSHDVIEQQVYTVGSTITYGESNPRSTDEEAAISRLSDAEGNLTFLSRADGFANYDVATAAPSYELDAEWKAKFVNNSNYNVSEHNDPNDAMPVTGAKNGMQLVDLRGADYDDPRWETLLDQLQVSEMKEMIALAGFSTLAAPSVGKVATTDCDGPAAINNNFTGVGSLGFPSATMIACSWNVDMAKLFGDSIGTMAEEMNVSGWYAPAMNMHRSAFGGRTFEYYSEDPLLSGCMAASAVSSAKEHGIYAYIKHFALNEQEYCRQSMLATWCPEQAIREIYLKPFEMCVKQGGATAVMSSYNYIGVRYTGAYPELLNDVLRGEWGFRGMVLTDYAANQGYGYMNADQIIRNGGSAFLATFDIGTNYVTDESSATAVRSMRQAVKDIMYTVVNSRAYEAGVYNVGMQGWQIAIIAVNILIVVALAAFEFVVVRNYRKRKATN